MLKHCIHSLLLGLFIILHIKFSAVGQSVEKESLEIRNDEWTVSNLINIEQTKCQSADGKIVELIK